MLASGQTLASKAHQSTRGIVSRFPEWVWFSPESTARTSLWVASGERSGEMKNWANLHTNIHPPHTRMQMCITYHNNNYTQLFLFESRCRIASVHTQTPIPFFRHSSSSLFINSILFYHPTNYWCILIRAIHAFHSTACITSHRDPLNLVCPPPLSTCPVPLPETHGSLPDGSLFPPQPCTHSHAPRAETHHCLHMACREVCACCVHAWVYICICMNICYVYVYV